MEMRPVITKAVVVCVAVAIAPWLSGGQEPLAMLISGFALFMGSVLVWRQPLSRRFFRGPLSVVFSLLIGLAVLSLLWTASRYSTGVWIVQWVMAALAFRLTYAVAGHPVGRKWLIGVYLLSAGLFAVAGIWMYLTSEYGRFTGTFYWANPAAAYLIPAIVVGLDLIRGASGRRLYGWISYTAVLGAAFLLADSRAATVVLAVTIGLYLIVAKFRKRYWIHILFTAIMAIALSYGFVLLSSVTADHSQKVAPGSRFSEAVKGESTSGSDRVYYLKSVGEMWFDHPVLGVGAGAYGDVHPQYQSRVVSASTSAHNIYAQVLAELGLAGSLLLATLLLVLIAGCLRGLFDRPELLPVAIGLIGLLMHFGLDIDARYPALLGLVGFSFGLMYTQWRSEWVKLSWKWPILSAAVLLPVVSLYFSESSGERGRVAQSDGELEIAAEYFGSAHQGVLYDPDYLNAHGINLYVLGGVGGTNGKTALALAHRAQAEDPRDGQHHQLEGRILLRKGDLEEAEAAFRRALALDEFNHPDYALDLAGALVRQQKADQALAVAKAMLDQYPPEVVSNRSGDESVAPALAGLESLQGEIYLSREQLGPALAAADRAHKLDPQSLRGRALKRRVEELRRSLPVSE